MIRGSCLCGGVRFEVGRANPIGLCHCSLCRKVSGVASNASFLVGTGDLKWLAGEDLLQVYTRPTGWRTTFCRRCGSPAPSLHPSGGAYWIPAGVLDDDPGVRVAMHIFVGSRAPWDEIGGAAPRFEEGFQPAAGQASHR
jgi:hypothetical protein